MCGSAGRAGKGKKEEEPPKPLCMPDIAQAFVHALSETLSNVSVAVVGSRGFPDLQMVRDFVSGLPSNSIVVSGGARGVDSAAAAAADARELNQITFPANWDRYGRSAGMRRNAAIVDSADVVVAFHDGKSPGTANSIQRARTAGKPVYVIPPDGGCE